MNQWDQYRLNDLYKNEFVKYQGTSNNPFQIDYIDEIFINNLFINAKNKIEEENNPSIKQFASLIVFIIQRLILLIDNYETLPPLAAQIMENGDFFIEWIFNDFRIGFVISEESESSWFLVGNTNKDSIQANGLLNKKTIVETVGWLTCFVIFNFS